MSGILQFLNPRGTIAANRSKSAPLVAGLAGTTGGFRVQWPSFDIFMHRIQELLQERQVKQIHTLYTGSDGTAAVKVTLRGR